MKSIKKKLLSVSTGIALVATSSASYVQAESDDLVKAAAVSVTNSLLQQKIEQGQHSLYSKDTLVINYTKPLSTAELNKMGLKVVRHSPQLKSITVQVKDEKKLGSVLRYLQSVPSVNSVQPSAKFQPLAYSDPKSSEMYHLSMLNIPQAQKLAGKNKVRVAVIDQGIDTSHPELKGKLLKGYNAVNPVSSPMADFHGTHVAGILGANKNNGIGGYGVNPNVEIVPIDVFDRGWGTYDYIIAEGILHAIEREVDVINMSIGGYFPSKVLEEAIKKATDAGITIVAAAGNGGDEHPNYPAAYEGVISVGNINNEKKLDSSSTRGASLDVVAPGTDIYNAIYEYEKGSSFQKMTGTSMASPVVAGVAALLLSKYPDLSPIEVDYILKHTADDLGKKGFDSEFGYGLINPTKALQFNPKDIPWTIKQTSNRDKLINDAREVEVIGKKAFTRKFTKPNQEFWVKVPLKAGQVIELDVNGSSPYDYSLLYQWDGSDEIMTINNAKQGKREAITLQAEEDTVLAIGVKDTYGHYGGNETEKSEALLNVTIPTELPIDSNTFDNPTKLLNLPFETVTETLFLEDFTSSDDDFFTFTVDEPQMVKMKVGAIPGVDASIAVYDSNMFFIDEDRTSEEAKELAREMFASEFYQYPLAYVNNAGMDSDETLIFQAEPNVEYYVNVSNSSNFFFGSFEYFMNPSMFMNLSNVSHSLTPYSFEMEKIDMPADEDGYPYGMEGTLEADAQLAEIAYTEEENNYVQEIKSIAISFDDTKKSGYLQTQYDLDWYTFTADKSGLVEIDLSKGEFVPMVDALKVNTVPSNSLSIASEEEVEELEEEEEMPTEEELEYFEYIGSNASFGWSSLTLDDKLYLSVQEGEEYYFQVTNNHFENTAAEGNYVLQKNYKGALPMEEGEPNDGFEEATVLKGKTATGVLSKASDIDYYYVENLKEQVYGINVKREEVTPALQKLYPKQILTPYYPIVALYEDVNKNGELDETEMERFIVSYKGAEVGSVYGSFKAKKGSNYFIEVVGFMEGSTSFSAIPYKLSLTEARTKDEDPYNASKKLNEIKPLKMAAKSKRLWTADGYLNSLDIEGDADWYTFTLDRKTKGKILLDAPQGIDGVIELYKDGKLVKEADYYPINDDEVMEVNLTKGKYLVKVKDANYQGSTQKYQLRVFME